MALIVFSLEVRHLRRKPEHLRLSIYMVDIQAFVVFIKVNSTASVSCPVVHLQRWGGGWIVQCLICGILILHVAFEAEIEGSRYKTNTFGSSSSFILQILHYYQAQSRIV